MHGNAQQYVLSNSPSHAVSRIMTHGVTGDEIRLALRTHGMYKKAIRGINGSQALQLAALQAPEQTW